MSLSSHSAVPIVPGDPWWLLKLKNPNAEPIRFELWLLWHFNLFSRIEGTA